MTHQERYQSLSEHVSSPNSEPSLKNGYQCSTPDCIANVACATWTDDGEIYVSSEKLPPGLDWNSAHRSIERASVTGMYYALDSWCNSYFLMEKDKKRRQHTFTIGKWVIHVIPKYRSAKVEGVTVYRRKKFSWKFEYWKSVDEGSFVYVTPWPKMVRLCIEEFKRCYNSALYSHDKESIRTCLKHVRKGSEKFYQRVTRWILLTFYSTRVEIIEDLAKREDVSFS